MWLVCFQLHWNPPSSPPPLPFYLPTLYTCAHFTSLSMSSSGQQPHHMLPCAFCFRCYLFCILIVATALLLSSLRMLYPAHLLKCHNIILFTHHMPAHKSIRLHICPNFNFWGKYMYPFIGVPHYHVCGGPVARFALWTLFALPSREVLASQSWNLRMCCFS